MLSVSSASFSAFKLCLRCRIERVVIAGVKTEPSLATLTVVGSNTAIPLVFKYNAAARLVTVKKPDVCVAEDFDIRFTFSSTTS